MSINSNSKETGLSLFQIFATLFAIIAFRLFLDSFAYPSAGGYFFPIERFIQLPLYFLSIFLSFSISTYLFTKSSIKENFIFVTKTFLFILIIPIVDFLLDGPSVDALKYVLINSNEFPKTFFLLLNPYSGHGITFGQHIGAFLIFMSLSFFIYKKTRSAATSLLSILLNYFILFLYATLPSILLLFNTNITTTTTSPTESYASMINGSWLMHKTEQTGLFNNLFSNTNFAHEIVVSRVFWILIVMQIGFIFYSSSKYIWKAFFDNARLTRVFYWLIIASIGMVISQKLSGTVDFINPINLITLLLFLMLLILNIWLAVFINDKEDIVIDTISNPNRPLIKKSISIEDWSFISIVLILLIIAGLITIPKLIAFLLILSQSLYYIYSIGPLKLKNNFITSSLAIGVTSVLISMAAFFLVSPDQHFRAFPLKAAAIILISYALLSNLKDIKDFAGDKQAAIKTLPVVFGLGKAKNIVAALCATVMITIPIILHTYQMLPISILISILLYYLFTKKEYQEKYIFMALFLYMLILFVVTL